MEKSESYIYEIGKMRFIVTPVYKDEGETIQDIYKNSCWLTWDWSNSTSLTDTVSGGII